MGLKNIVIVNDYAYIEGGATKIAVQTAVELSKNPDLRVWFFAGCGEACRELKESKVTIVSLGMYDLLSNPSRLNAAINGIRNRKAGKELEKLLSSLNREETVVHIHSWTKSLSSIVFLAAAKCGVKTFLTLHDYFTVCPNGGCYNYEKNEICTVRPMSPKCLFCNCDARSYPQKLWRYARQIVQNRAFRKCKDLHYIFISYFSKKQLAARGLNPAIERQYMVHNPVDCDNARHRVHAEDNELYTFIGRLSPEKGAALFCEAVSRANVKAVVIGDGSMKKELEKKYPVITFAGWLNKNEIDKWLEKTRALIFPSLLYEAFGLSVCEAQMLGVPCIVSDCCAASEFVCDGKSGWTFSTGGAASLVNAIDKSRDDLVVKSFSENIFEDSFDYYGASDYAAALLGVFTEKEQNLSFVEA